MKADMLQMKVGQTVSISKRSQLVAVFLLAIVTTGLYLNSFPNQFTNWDDQMIYSNWQTRSLAWENVCKIFTYVRGSTYQPVRVLSYAVDHYFWGLNPLGYHITNILFYILTCLMVFLTLQKLSFHLRNDPPPDSHFRVGLFGSLLFAAHPVHVEAVTWLAARKEGLQGFFFFSAFYLYLKAKEVGGRKKIVFFGVVLLSFLLAILSKPSAVVFPAVLLIYEMSSKQKRWVDSIKTHGWFFFLSLLLSLLFAFVLIKVMLDAGGIKAYHGGTFFNNLLVSFYIFLYNIKLLFLTINYSAAYTLPIPNPIVGLKTLLFIGITFLLFGMSLWSLKKTKIIFFSFFFFFVTLLPYLNLLPISTILADRYVFISSFSYCFLLGIGFDRFYRVVDRRFSERFFKLLSGVLFLLLLSGYSFMTIHQNQVWENSYTLWSDAVEKYPENNTANALMGAVYMELAMDEKAAGYLEKAIEILPMDYQSRNNLGIVYGRLGHPEKALKELVTALMLHPDNETIKINLALHYQRQKDYGKSEEILKFLQTKKPQDVQIRFRLGMLYKEMGRYEKAVSEWVKAIDTAPGIPKLYEEVGNVYISCMKDIEKGKDYYTKGVEAASKSKLKREELRWMVQDLECHR